MTSVEGAPFWPYLPQDNIESSTSEGLVADLSGSLELLLKAPSTQFWRTVKANGSLVTFLGTYLQFCRRPYDVGEHGQLNAPSLARRELARTVFVILLRLVSRESGSISREEQQQWLADKSVVDIPRLFDVAVLFGPANRELVTEFVFNLQPDFQTKLDAAIPLVAENLADVAQTCTEAARGLQEESGSQTLQQISDGLAFLLDVAATLTALTDVCPSAATLLTAEGSPVMATLESVHCRLVPAVNRAVESSGGAANPTPATEQVHARLEQLPHHLRKLLYTLLSAAFLHPLPPDPMGAGPSSGRGTVFEARERGQGLLAALQAGGGGAEALAMLKLMDREHQVSAGLASALQIGHVALDKSQQETVCGLLGCSSLPTLAAASGLEGETASSWDAERRALLNQIQEVLPGYGEGFLIACLDAAGQNAERVIHQLLEGTLPAELARLDPQMPAAPQNPRPAPTAGEASSSGKLSGLAWAELESRQQEDARARAPRASNPLGKPKPSAHRGTAFAMQSTQQDRAVARLHAQAAQWEEYDDEYDDSFDDLGTDFGADAGAGDRLDNQPGGVSTNPDSFPPLPGGFPSRPAQAPRQGPPARGGKPLWVLEDRIYNYAKEGATAVAGQQAAEAAVHEFKSQGTFIDGLGAGGNKPQAFDAGERGGEDAGGRSLPEGGGRGRGRGRGQSQGGRGARRDHAFKDSHKSAIANHHRKDRALRKAGGPPN